MAKGTKEEQSKHRPVYQPWYEGDFWTIRVRRLHPMARLMYRSMLQGAWDLDKVGVIPNEPDLLKALADCPDDPTWEMYGSAVMEMFELSRNGKFYSNSRQMQEFATWKEKHQSYSKRGTDGANAKKEKKLKGIEDYSLAEAGLEPSFSPAEKDGSNQAKLSKAKLSKANKDQNPAQHPLRVVDLPDWIPSQKYDAWLEMRKKIKKPATEAAQLLAIKKLENLKSRGHQPGDVLDQSIMNDWQDLFEIRSSSNGKHQANSPGGKGNPGAYRNPERTESTEAGFKFRMPGMPEVPE